MRIRLRPTLLVLMLLAVFPFSRASIADVLINEVDSDTPTLPVNDDREFVELYNTGPSSVDLAAEGYVLVFYNGNGDVSYLALNLTGAISAGAHYVAGNPGVANVSADTWAPNRLQNGPDAVALYRNTSAAAFPNGTPVAPPPAGAILVDALVYDTNDADDPGLLAALTPGQPQINEGGGSSSAADSNQRMPDGAGGAFNTSSYVQRPPTPGAPNGEAVPIMVPHIAAARAIGAGFVRITGTVTVTVDTGVFNAARSQFAVQDDSGADGQSAILIDDPHDALAAEYRIGDRISQLTGHLTTYSGLLELQPTAPAVSAGTGGVIHPLLVIPALADFDSIESELIQIDGAVIVDGSRTPTWTADTNYDLEGPPGILINVIRMEDGVDAVGQPLPDSPFNVRGIAMEYAPGARPYQIQPRMMADFGVAPLPTPTPTPAISGTHAWQRYR